MNDWISIHIPAPGDDADPLLRDTVAPLVAHLRRRGLIQRYFFIRYGLGGPHVRLRLLAAPRVHRDLIEAKAATALDNTGYRYVPYEPEYHRYGGPAGMALAEWHFEASSDIVLRLLDLTTTRSPTVLLGQSAYLSLTLCRAFLAADSEVARFLAHYRDRWRTWASNGPAAMSLGERTYQQSNGQLRRWVDKIGSSRTDAPTRPPSAPMPSWQVHCRQLRNRLLQLTASQQIRPQPSRHVTTIDNPTVTDPRPMIPTLLDSYLHMTNNRLGINTFGEIYLSHILHRCLQRVPTTITASHSGK